MKERIEHPNRSRLFGLRQVGNVQPGDKSHRFDVEPEVQRLADRLRKLINKFQLTEADCVGIIKSKFGKGCGYHTLRTFLDDKYGVGFRPRALTFKKYKYLKIYLQAMEKRLQNPSTAVDYKAVSPTSAGKNKKKQTKKPTK